MANTMNVEIKVEDNRALVLRLFSVATYRGLDAIGATAERHAKEIVTKKVYDLPPKPSYPQRTGYLRNSISHQVKMLEKAVYVGAGAPYAIYVELGTSRMKERAFVRPAAQNYGDEYRQLMEDSLKNA